MWRNNISTRQTKKTLKHLIMIYPSSSYCHYHLSITIYPRPNRISESSITWLNRREKFKTIHLDFNTDLDRSASKIDMALIRCQGLGTNEFKTIKHNITSLNLVILLFTFYNKSLISFQAVHQWLHPRDNIVKIQVKVSYVLEWSFNANPWRTQQES